MKILIIGNGEIANINNQQYIGKHTAHFCEELEKYGLNVGLLQFEQTMQMNDGLLNYPLKSTITVHSLSIDNYRGKIGKIFSYFLMSFLIIKTVLKYDFIYIFYPGHIPSLASIVNILLRKDYALYIRGEHNIKTKVGHFMIKHSKFCLTVSDLLKKDISKINKNTEVIAPMIDFDKQDILLDRQYSNDDIVRCLFVGRVEMRKGIYDLKHAIDILNNERDDVHFDIVGGGESFDELVDYFETIENVCLRGQISDTTELLNMYRQADLFIFPSHDEGFPRVLYEAMMARVPIITTMVGGIGGFMKDHHNCLAIESQNPQSIVKAVNRMLDTEELKMKIVNQSTQDILKLFDGRKKRHSLLLFDKLKYDSKVMKND